MRQLSVSALLSKLDERASGLNAELIQWSNRLDVDAATINHAMSRLMNRLVELQTIRAMVEDMAGIPPGERELMSEG